MEKFEVFDENGSMYLWIISEFGFFVNQLIPYKAVSAGASKFDRHLVVFGLGL